MRKTKIIATLGPSTSSEAEISALIRAGMDIARINLSHGSRKSHAELIANIKKARKRLGTHAAILLDTRGPVIRIGVMDEQIDNGLAASLDAGLLKPNDTVAITAGLPLQTAGTTNMLRVSTITDKRSADSDERNDKIGYILEEAKDKDQPAVFPERRWKPYGSETVI